MVLGSGFGFEVLDSLGQGFQVHFDIFNFILELGGFFFLFLDLGSKGAHMVGETYDVVAYFLNRILKGRHPRKKLGEHLRHIDRDLGYSGDTGSFRRIQDDSNCLGWRV